MENNVQALRKESDLQVMYEEARQLMLSLGYNAEIIPVRLNGRLRRALGKCYRSYNPLMNEWVGAYIEINKNFFLYSKKDVVMNTLVHEICHQVCTNGRGHGKEWQVIAKDVSSKSTYKITTYAGEDKIEYQKLLPKKKKKYAVRCKLCNREWQYTTKTIPYKSSSKCKCPYCNDFSLYSVDL